MAIWIALTLGAYLLGSVPAAYLVVRLSRRIDLRQYGTGQVGAGNLWRMTSWKLGLPVGVFDFSKGLVMVWAAQLLDLSIAQQIIVGAAAIAGHNWSVFLRFHGGRGVATTIGVVFILPFININEMTPWPPLAFLTILVVGTVATRSSPVPVLFSMVALPLVSLFYEPLSVTLGFLTIFLIVVIRRLTARRRITAVPVSNKRLLFNRLFFDRDIMDRRTWMYQRNLKVGRSEESEQKED